MSGPRCTLQQHLVALDAILFDLVKLALELSLALQSLLSTTDKDGLPIDIFSIHIINCLQTRGAATCLRFYVLSVL